MMVGAPSISNNRVRCFFFCVVRLHRNFKNLKVEVLLRTLLLPQPHRGQSDGTLPPPHPSSPKPHLSVCTRSGRSSFVTLDCTLTPFRDAPPGERSWEPVVVSDCVFRVEACLDRHDAARASLSHRHLEVGNAGHMGMQQVIKYTFKIHF